MNTQAGSIPDMDIRHELLQAARWALVHLRAGMVWLVAMTVTASDQVPALQVTLPDLASTREHWRQSPWSAVWNQPVMKATRSAGLAALADLHADLKPDNLQLFHALTIHGAAVADGHGHWRFIASTPGATADIIAMATAQRPTESAGQMVTHGWTWDWGGDQVVAANTGDLAMVGPADLPPGTDLGLTVDFVRLFTQAGEWPSVDLFKAIGLTHLAYTAALTADGARDRLVLPGFRPPFGPLVAADLDAVPARALAVLAFNLDGARLSEWVQAIGTTPEGADALEYYKKTLQPSFGTAVEMAASLSGPVVAVAMRGAPFPEVTLSVPAGGGWDRLVGLLLARVEPDQAASDQVAVPIPGVWPSVIWVQRDPGHWRLSTGAVPTTPVKSPERHQDLAEGTRLLVSVDLAGLATTASGYLALAARKDQRPGLARARDVALALARSGLRMDAQCCSEGDGSVIAGRHALAAGVIPFLATLGAVLGVDHLVVSERENAARSALTALVKRTDPAGWPASDPELDEPPLPCRRLAGPWVRYLPPDPDLAAADQPVAIVAPDFLGKTGLWLRHDGAIRSEPKSVVMPLWKRAEAFASGHPPGAAADWTEALAQARSQRTAKLVTAEFPALNIRIAVPAAWNQDDKPQAPWTGLWRKDDHLMFGLLAEPGAGNLGAGALLDAMIASRRTLDPEPEMLWRGPWALAGLRGERARMICDNGKGIVIRFDLTAAEANGFLYQIVTWSDLTVTEAELVTQAEVVLDSVTLIEPNRRSPVMAPPEIAVEKVPLPGMPLDLDLSGLGWFHRAAAADANRLVGLRLKNPTGKAIAFVVSAGLGGREANDRQVAAGLLQLINQDVAAVADAIPVSLAGTTGLALRYSTGKLPIRAWTLRIEDRATLIAVFSDDESHLPDAVGDQVMERLRPSTAALPATDPAADSVFASGIGRYLVSNQRWREALPWLCAGALATPPDADRFCEALLAYCRVEQWQEGLEWLDAHAGSLVDHLSVASYRPYFLGRCGRDDEAIAAYHLVFSAGFADASDFTDFLAVQRRGHDTTAFDAVIKAYPTLAKQPTVIIKRAHYLVEDGQEDLAVALLRQGLLDTPGDLSLTVALTDIHLDRSHHVQAREDLAPALHLHPRSAGLRHREGIALYRLARYREAQVAFRAASDLDPGLKGPRDFLAAIDRDLGKGDTSRIAARLEAVAAIEAEPVPALSTMTAGGCYLLRATAMAWNPTDGYRRSDRHVIAVTDRAACETFSTLRFGFDPAYEQFHVNRLIVRDGEGKTVATGSIEDWYVLDDHDGVMATTDKTVSLPVPGLRPGYQIECVVTRGQRASHRLPFTTVRLGTRRPVNRATLSITAPVGSLTIRTGGSLRTVTNGDITRVEGSDLPARPNESLIPNDDADLPVVWAGSATGTWEAEGRAYLADLKPFLQPDLAVTAAAESCVADLVGPQERIAALTDLVQRDIAYAAVEFGRRGRIPQPAALTLEKRLGDCKDQAVLLQRLLAAAGVTAHLALVPRDGWLIEEIPDLDQFDHLVVAIPGTTDITVIDPTAKDLDPAVIPRSEAGARMLLLDPDLPRLFSAPTPGPGGTEVERVVTCADDGALAISEQVRMTGYAAAHWRSLLRGLPPEDLHRKITDCLGAPLAKLHHAEVTGLEVARQPLLLSLRYVLRPRLRSDGGALVGQIPDVWGTYRWAWSVTRGGERLRPVNLIGCDTLQVRTRITAPQGQAFQIHRPESQARGLLLDFSEESDGSWLIQRLVPVAGRYPADQYQHWCDQVDSALALMEIPVRISSKQP